MTRPPLIVVCGAPGSGKSTLARELAGRLRLAIVAKDDIKEALADALGAGDRARSRELGAAAYAVMWSVTRRTLVAGAGVVLEANFYREQAEPVLRELAAIADARVVLCRCDPVIRRSRYAERDRHPVHLDAEILAREWIGDDEINAIDIGVPSLVIDTTRPDGVDIDAIAAWMSTETGPRTSVHRPVD